MKWNDVKRINNVQWNEMKYNEIDKMEYDEINKMWMI